MVAVEQVIEKTVSWLVPSIVKGEGTLPVVVRDDMKRTNCAVHPSVIVTARDPAGAKGQQKGLESERSCVQLQLQQLDTFATAAP